MIRLYALAVATALTLTLTACGPDLAGEHAAREVARHKAYLEHHDKGVTLKQARSITEAGLRAWQAQAYYLRTGERPEWMKPEDD